MADLGEQGELRRPVGHSEDRTTSRVLQYRLEHCPGGRLVRVAGGLVEPEPPEQFRHLPVGGLRRAQPQADGVERIELEEPRGALYGAGALSDDAVRVGDGQHGDPSG